MILFVYLKKEHSATLIAQESERNILKEDVLRLRSGRCEQINQVHGWPKSALRFISNVTLVVLFNCILVAPLVFEASGVGKKRTQNLKRKLFRFLDSSIIHLHQSNGREYDRIATSAAVCNVMYNFAMVNEWADTLERAG